MLIKRNNIEGAIRGLIFGDALGVPYEFYRREYFDNPENKVTELVEGGAHGMPLGYWSDDSGLMLACMQSLMTGGNFVENAVQEMVYGWYRDGRYMNEDHIFDIGCTTDRAFRNIVGGKTWKDSGLTDEATNGNGALMKVLPYSLCKHNKIAKENIGLVNNRTVVEMCGITHNHPISHIACLLYSEMIRDILDDGFIDYKSIPLRVDTLSEINGIDIQFSKYIKRYDQLKRIKELDRSEINSSGYVVDTLIASVWCFETTNSYMECVCKAVELGGDTDTIGAIAGSLAGAKYGFDSFRVEHKDIPIIDYVEDLIENFIKKLDV